MINWLIILLILFLIFIIPFPIKIYFMYNMDELIIKILWKTYKFTPKDLTKRQRDTVNKAEKSTKKSLNIRKFTFKQIKYILQNLKNNTLKPSINMSIELTYGVDDAALTGILYGIIYNIYSYVQYYTYSCFKVKDMKLNLYPEFNKKIIDAKVNSIIYINLVKIIYMFIIIFKGIHSANKDSNNCVTKINNI